MPLPPLDLPLEAISALCTLIPGQRIEVRERRRLLIIHELCVHNQHQTAQILSTTTRTVRRWKNRALRFAQELAESPNVLSHGEIQRRLLAAVADAPRPGAPLTYTAEQQCAIIAMAVRDPGEFSLPIQTWTHRELAEVANSQRIAPGISRSTVGRILAQANLRPHRVKYWENPKIEDEKTFRKQVAEICLLYQSSPQRLGKGSHTVCIDEKTGVQALERIHPDKPARPGQRALLEFEYRRHGTQAVIPVMEVATGRILHTHVGPTRTELDFAAVVEAAIQTDPQAEWIFVADQLNTHKSEALVRLVAKHTQFGGDLGRKGHAGILKNLHSRETFLRNSAHRIRFVYTPKHCSWLNQIEIWFGVLTRKALKQASFASTQQLRERILQFVDYFNRTLARAFKWTYRGKALQA